MFLVCDLETTSNKICNAEIITGYFILANDSLEIVDEWEIKLKPRLWHKDAHQAQLIHGISEKQCQSFAPQETLKEILKRIPDYTHFVCHANREMFGITSTFDYAVLKQSFLDLSCHFDWYKKCPDSKIISTHQVFKANSRQVNYTERNFSLDNVCQFLGITLHHHDAKSDCMACFEVLKYLIKTLGVENVLESSELNKKPPKEVEVNPKRAGRKSKH